MNQLSICDIPSNSLLQITVFSKLMALLPISERKALPVYMHLSQKNYSVIEAQIETARITNEFSFFLFF